MTFTEEINIIINNTNAYQKGSVINSFFKIIYLILIKLKNNIIIY